MSKNYFELQEKYEQTDSSDDNEFSEELTNPQQPSNSDHKRKNKSVEPKKESD